MSHSHSVPNPFKKEHPFHENCSCIQKPSKLLLSIRSVFMNWISTL